MQNTAWIRWHCAAVLALAGSALAATAQTGVPPAGAASVQTTEDAAAAAQAERDRERAQIQQRRAALESQRLADEAQCYQRFVVESCLQQVRAQQRETEEALRAREVVLNDAERREKAAYRRKTIEDNQAEQQAREAEAAGRPRPAGASSSSSRQASADDKSAQARQRADEQRARQSSHSEQQQRREATEPNRIAESRARYEAKQQAAAERRAKYEKARAEPEASGRKPAAPLPPRPAASTAP